jgi:hypothetical protein
MLRRYFFLVYPLAVAAAAGLTYLHFQQIAQAQADQDEAAFVQVQPPAQPPAAPANQPAPRKPAHGRARPPRPKSKDELQTPYLRYLFDQLDGIEGGTDQERTAVREAIYDADVELRDSMGYGALRRIREANRPRPAFRVQHGPVHIKAPVTDPSPLTPAARKPQPKAQFVDPARPAAPPAPRPNNPF